VCDVCDVEWHNKRCRTSSIGVEVEVEVEQWGLRGTCRYNERHEITAQTYAIFFKPFIFLASISSHLTSIPLHQPPNHPTTQPLHTHPQHHIVVVVVVVWYLPLPSSLSSSSSSSTTTTAVVGVYRVIMAQPYVTDASNVSLCRTLLDTHSSITDRYVVL
jgi:hypothetical protein